MSLLRKGILAGSGSIICAGIGVFTSMILSRALLPEGMGRYQIPLTFGVLTVTIISLGIGNSNIFFLNKHRIEHRKIVMNSVWFSFMASVFLLLLIPVIFFCFHNYFGALRFLTQIIFSMGIAALLCFNLLRPVLTADLKIRQEVIARITNRLVILIIVAFAFILGYLSVDTALIATSISHVTVLILVVYFLKEHFDFKISFSWRLFKETLAYGLKLFAANFAYLVNVSLGLMLVRYLMPNDFINVGYYGRAVAVCGLIMLFPTSVGPLLYARWSGLSGRDRKAQVELAMRLHFAAGSVSIAVLMLFGSFIINILYGEAFLPAVPAMRVLSLGVALRCVFNVFSNFLASDGRPHITTYILIFSVVLAASFTFALVPHIGIIGAALADVIAWSLVLTIGLVLLRRYYGLELKNMLLIKKSDFKYLLHAIRKKSDIPATEVVDKQQIMLQ